LKLRLQVVGQKPFAVAPRAGAWIETILPELAMLSARVAPRAGAWIETLVLLTSRVTLSKSHPARVRGLKLLITYIVAMPGVMSHPARVRGLKLLITLPMLMPGVSRTPRGCVD